MWWKLQYLDYNIKINKCSSRDHVALQQIQSHFLLSQQSTYFLHTQQFIPKMFRGRKLFLYVQNNQWSTGTYCHQTRSEQTSTQFCTHVMLLIRQPQTAHPPCPQVVKMDSAINIHMSNYIQKQTEKQQLHNEFLTPNRCYNIYHHPSKNTHLWNWKKGFKQAISKALILRVSNIPGAKAPCKKSNVQHQTANVREYLDQKRRKK